MNNKNCCYLPGINAPLDYKDIYINFKSHSFTGLIIIIICFIYVASIGNIGKIINRLKQYFNKYWNNSFSQLISNKKLKQEWNQEWNQEPEKSDKTTTQSNFKLGIIALLLGIFFSFWGWELNWSTGCGMDKKCGKSIQQRLLNKSTPITKPIWLNGLFNSLFDGCIIGISFMLGQILFPKAFENLSYKFIIFIIFFGVIQNIIVTYLYRKVISFEDIAWSFLAKNPTCRDPSNVICWYNQDMWIKLPIICYIIILLLNRREKRNRKFIQS